jgi:predicted MarR family transcription regulator
MNSNNPDPGVARALALSEEILSVAESGNLESLESLDRQRLELLQSFRKATRQVAAADQALLQQIAQLNDRAIGLLEHQRRGKGRDLDMAAVGRRAVAAYSSIRMQR